MIFSSLALVAIAALVRRRAVTAVALCFLLITFVWRLVASAYLDMAGPVHSEELGRMVGGGTAGEAFGLIILLTLLPFFWFLRPVALLCQLRPLPSLGPVTGRFTLGDAVFALCALFVALLYGDMLWRSVVPLFACMERYEYTRQHAGPLHLALIKYGQLIALFMGSFLVYPRLRGRLPDLRFLALMVAVFGYCLLTGHRFSAFYAFGTFFVMPWAAFLLLREADVLPVLGEPPGAAVRLFQRPAAWITLTAAVVMAIFGALFNSYFFIRSEHGACKGADVPAAASAPPVFIDKDAVSFVSHKLYQRVLVQPVELWWVSWERVVREGTWRSHEAAHFMFVDPGVSAGNTGIQYIMLAALGKERAAELRALGQQFAGGYPEVFFELLGPVAAWPVLLIIALVSAWLLRTWLLALAEGRLLTAFWAIYVFHATTVMYIGGMLTFLVAATFWAKVSLLVLFYWLERRAQREGRTFLPWDLNFQPGHI